jgi:hypothetical protein
LPAEAERRRRDAADGRCFDVDIDQVSFHGTSQVHGELDLADALDLDNAIRAGAARLAALGNAASLDVRRSQAAGELARRQLALDLSAESAGGDGDRRDHGDTDGGADGDGRADGAAAAAGQMATGEGSDAASSGAASGADVDGPHSRCRAGVKARKPRQTVLHVHLSEAAVRGLDGDPGIGRVENTRAMVTAEQIAAWCGHPDTELVVKPVIDLADHVHVDQYEVPDRIAEPVALRDQTCAFPWCTRPARTCHPDEHDCDDDHIREYARGGPTCSCNIAPLCRRHHRLKTHSAWRYIVLEPGSYLWSSPHGYQFLRDHTGTLDVSRDKHPGAAADDAAGPGDATGPEDHAGATGDPPDH